MKEIPKKDRPDVAGGAASTYPQVPSFPEIWPRTIEDGTTIPEVPDSPLQSPSNT